MPTPPQAVAFDQRSNAPRNAPEPTFDRNPDHTADINLRDTRNPPHAHPREDEEPPQASRPLTIDAHVHLCDFRQEVGSPEELLRQMDLMGVDAACVFGMPIKKHDDGSEPFDQDYYFRGDSPCIPWSATDDEVGSAISRLSPAQRSRLLPFICGFEPTDKDAVRHIERLIHRYPGLFVGIGEVFFHHGQVTAYRGGPTPRPNHPAMDPVYALAAEHNLPVLIHSDLAPEGERRPVWLPEVRAALRSHPKTRFIWAHAGISRRVGIDRVTDILRGTLAEYDNLTLDLSWSVLLDQELNDEARWHPDWRNLVETFPTRFVIGSDAVGPRGIAQYPQEISPFLELLAQLDPTTARLVSGENMRRLLPVTVKLQPTPTNPTPHGFAAQYGHTDLAARS